MNNAQAHAFRCEFATLADSIHHTADELRGRLDSDSRPDLAAAVIEAETYAKAALAGLSALATKAAAR